MNFAEAMKQEATHAVTENGAFALNTTSNALVDLFGMIGALRSADEVRITTLFSEAYQQDPLIAARILFYARDIRGGLGERRTFRIILKFAADHYPEMVRPNLDLIGVFGRYDDMYTLIGTRLEDDMWAAMKMQFEEDRRNMQAGHAISLLAKWIKSADASSETTRKLGILTAQKLGYRVYDFKRIVKQMRKHIGIVEGLMSTGQWSKITYDKVPSRAMMIYQNAFQMHDQERFESYLEALAKGETKINASTLYPYDLVMRYFVPHNLTFKKAENTVVEEQWKALPNYVEDTNVLVMADTSGSMLYTGNGRPFCTAIGLAIYFAERNTGDFHNLFMTFSSQPSIVSLKGSSLYQKIINAAKAPWGGSTNLEAAFNAVLELALKNHISSEEMPKAIVVVSDMEIDRCSYGEWTFYEQIREKFRQYGYQIPTIIFWNVESRHDIFHADVNRKGVQLVSGQSTVTFKHVIECIGHNPVEAMNAIVNSERYACITVEKIEP
ncbi:MAG: DUF2828 family protein [Lachnospiraceae bacterium]